MIRTVYEVLVDDLRGLDGLRTLRYTRRADAETAARTHTCYGRCPTVTEYQPSAQLLARWRREGQVAS